MAQLEWLVEYPNQVRDAAREAGAPSVEAAPRPGRAGGTAEAAKAMRRRVLYVLQNHPVVRPGGAEVYALELYDAMRHSKEFEPVLFARIGESGDVAPTRHPSAPFSVVGNDPNQYFLLTDIQHFDSFLETFHDKSLYAMYIADFLRSHRPDVVHFQHAHSIGYDFLTLVRRMMPHVPIVYTLHDFSPMCHRDGRMVRTKGEELCSEPSPRRCNECFPEWSPQHFFLREQFIKSHLSEVDLFLAPSRFLLERYIDWGMPREKLRFEDYGRIPQQPSGAPLESRPRTNLGFFGQVSPFKGLDVLLGAMQILLEQAPDVHLFVHGANFDVLPAGKREELEGALHASGSNVTFAGSYNPASIPSLMSQVDWVVVPSRWWENSPLVIQEAFMHGRPVICSDIGGMAEKVTDGLNGLHFTVGSAVSLAETIRRAVSTPGLWERLREGMSPVFGMDEHVANLTTIYDELIAAKANSERKPATLVRAAG